MASADCPLDRILSGLRQLAAEYEIDEPPYTLIPGETASPTLAGGLPGPPRRRQDNADR